MIKSNKYLVSLLLMLSISSCNSIQEKNVGAPTGPEGQIMAAGDEVDPEGTAVKSDEHRVIVQEVLNASRYTYLQVQEDEKNYWIAIPRQEVEVGAVYYFTGGLLKKNFNSREFDREFETLYLVSGIVPASGEVASGQGIDHSSNISDQVPETEKNIAESQLISLTELFNNPEKYNGKLVTVSGKCVKVNPMIMNRNWVHIQNGSGIVQELTITTNDQVKMGDFIHMEGIIGLDKDFGAGYHYDVIMEKARLVRVM